MTAATSRTATSKASAVTDDGFDTPLTLRTYCWAAATTSSAVAGGWRPRRVVMLRHMAARLGAGSLSPVCLHRGISVSRGGVLQVTSGADAEVVRVVGDLDEEVLLLLSETLEGFEVPDRTVVLDLTLATTTLLTFVVLARSRSRLARAGARLLVIPEPGGEERIALEEGLARYLGGV